LGDQEGGVRKNTNGRGGVKGIEDRREYPVERENREQQLNIHAPNLSPGKRLCIFFVLSRGGEKRQQLSARRRKESKMQDQNKQIFFSFKNIAKNHFDRTDLSKDLSLYSELTIFETKE
jgi:hypothetical protein